MKAIIQCYTPKECIQIANGKQISKMCKTAPKEVPFKVYMYCIKAKKLDDQLLNFFEGCTFNVGIKQSYPNHNCYSVNGSIVGEFVCNKVDKFRCCTVPYKKENNLFYGHFIDNGVYKVNGCKEGVVFERNDRYADSMLNNNDLAKMCLSAQDVFNYTGISKCFKNIHISELKIYDRPKKLNEFKKPCVDKYQYCQGCKHGLVVLSPDEEEYALYHGGYYDTFDTVCTNRITMPPRSWCYVEELEE